MKMVVLAFPILALVVFISGCTNTDQPIGGQTDDHGCLIAAGYSWCEAKQECLRVWEKYCPTESRTPHENLMEAAIQYVKQLDEYKNENGRNLEVVETFQGECMGCGEVSLKFDLDSASGGTKDVITIKVTLDGWELKDSAKSRSALQPGLSFEDAKEIAEKSECVNNGTLKETYFYNENTRTWWFDLDIVKRGCSPACVVSEDTRTAEINWRCTGLIVRDEMTEQLCGSTRGHWNNCSNSCVLDNAANSEISCPAVCEELCECGGIAGFSCPDGYTCQTPEGIADALGYCV